MPAEKPGTRDLVGRRVRRTREAPQKVEEEFVAERNPNGPVFTGHATVSLLAIVGAAVHNLKQMTWQLWGQSVQLAFLCLD